MPAMLKFFTRACGLLAMLFLGALTASAAPKERWKTLPGFTVEQVLGAEAKSLVAMTFTEAGEIIGSAEQGPLMLIRNPVASKYETDKKSVQVSTFCDKVKNCQGILCYQGRVYCVGDGPDGTAFYRLTDENKDGVADKVESLFKFKGGMGEHGPHQPIVGPDGLIYIMIGNHAGYGAEPAKTSPHYGYYEGDIIQPRYEDANGHASGIKVPGGSVIRCDADGKNVELFCGGFRNAYDHAFNSQGELFTYDSDMEWDIGLPWYRPTRINHLVPGGDYGWRSGWAVWPDYFFDSLGAVIDIGRGSPTGVAFYNADAYPDEYKGDFMIADWSRGYIIGVRMKADGASYKGQQYNFLEGQPLNVSDLEVGPDGNVYFCTGGRGTAGGIFRVVSTKTQSVNLFNPEEDAEGTISSIFRSPYSPDTALDRAGNQHLKKALGEKWEPELRKFIQDKSEKPNFRANTLQRLSGDLTDKDVLFLAALSVDDAPEVRGEAVYLLGLHKGEEARTALLPRLTDAEPRVRRLACESLVRSGHAVPIEPITKLLVDQDRYVAWAARRLLERQPLAEWEKTVLDSKDFQVFSRGSVALLIVDQKKAAGLPILDRCEMWLQKPLAEGQRLDLYRLLELALIRGETKPAEVLNLCALLAEKFPSFDPRENRELIRLLTYLQDLSIAEKLLPFLDPPAANEIQAVEQRHLAMYARFLKNGWTSERRQKLLAYYDAMRQTDGQGNSFKGYFANAMTDYLKAVPAAEQIAIIAAGKKHPNGAAAIIKTLNAPLSVEQSSALAMLLETLGPQPPTESGELLKETLAALGRGGDEATINKLKAFFESTPELRGELALGFAQAVNAGKTRAEYYPLLLRALAVVEGQTAREVISALQKFPPKDLTPQLQRQVILLGLNLKDAGGKDAVKLMEHWNGKKLGNSRESVLAALAHWQEWYAAIFPAQPEAKLPIENPGNKWSMAQILEHAQKSPSADPARGAAVFEKANCIKCHRYGPKGEGIGPDLSNVGKRFQKKEIVESILYPSQVISDQFAAKTVQLNDGRSFTGLVADGPDNTLVVLQANTEKASVPKSAVEEILPSKISAMPDNLFGPLTLEEIADLLHYLSLPAPEAGAGK